MCTHSTALHACGADIRACLWHVGIQSDTVASAAMAVAYWSGLKTKDRRESSVGWACSVRTFPQLVYKGTTVLGLKRGMSMCDGSFSNGPMPVPRSNLNPSFGLWRFQSLRGHRSA